MHLAALSHKMKENKMTHNFFPVQGIVLWMLKVKPDQHRSARLLQTGCLSWIYFDKDHLS